jgi:hypothetical protein
VAIRNRRKRKAKTTDLMNGSKRHTVARAMHDIGLGAWFGGSLMGAIGLDRAASAVADPSDRTRVVNEGWLGWKPIQTAAIGSYLLGSTLLARADRRRKRHQKGLRTATAMKTLFTVGAVGATAWSSSLGRRIQEAGEVPVIDGTTPMVETPHEIAETQQRLRMAQWAVPAGAAALIALSSRMDEDTRPSQVAWGVLKGYRDKGEKQLKKAQKRAEKGAVKARKRAEKGIRQAKKRTAAAKKRAEAAKERVAA